MIHSCNMVYEIFRKLHSAGREVLGTRLRREVSKLRIHRWKTMRKIEKLIMFNVSAFLKAGEAEEPQAVRF